MILCIAEKPSVGKDLAEILGAKSRKDGYYEGNGYQVSWTFGHLCTLKAPDEYTKDWKYWQLRFLPMIPPRFGIKVMDNDGVQKQFNTLQRLIQSATEVVNCGDAGIEGELIQRWVLAKAKCDKPVKRLWISSLTEEAIKEGFANLKEASDYDLLYAAGNARAIGDWLLGMNASRLYTLKYANGKGVLSIGRVQTPTLALIVNRHLEIENFVPQTYWELKTKYRDVLFSASKGRFNEKEKGVATIEQIKESEFEITSFAKKKGKEAPPRLFDLTSLQVECNKKVNLSAEETLQTIQKLYERKLVTYPRVDTTFLTDDMYPKIPKILEGIKPYAKYTEKLKGKKLPKSKKIFDNKKVTDHHAIIPTGVDPSGLHLREKDVYDIITRRFIAAFYPDCIISNTTVLGEAAEIEFKATGKEILEDGWRELYPKRSNDGDKDDAQLMPTFEKGEKGAHEPELQEKQTQPPKSHTEATLLRAMETAGKQVDDDELRDLMKENGIGRPSTRANIIETLFRRRYIKKVRKSLQPTETGIQLIKTINNELLKSVELTGIWEKKLRQIEKNEYDAKQFIGEMKQMVTDLVLEVKTESGRHITIEEEKKEEEAKADKKVAKSTKKKASDEPQKCPKCKEGDIMKGKSAFGCSKFKSGCNFVVTFEQFGKKLTEKQISSLIQKGKTAKIKGFTIDGEKQEGKLVLNDDFSIGFEKQEAKAATKEEPKELKCPNCGKGIMMKGKAAWGCSEYKNGCKTVFMFTDLQENYKTTELTNDILKKLSK